MHHLLFLLLMAASTAALSTTVYKTVDEAGVVSFSDTPPAGQVPAEIVQITVPVVDSPELHQARLAAMRETTDRMASDRREREQHRAQLKATKARAQSLRYPAQPAADGQPYYSAGYSQQQRRRPHIPWRPGYRPHPVQPVVRPPLSPRRYSSSNAQLMRPLVSGRN